MSSHDPELEKAVRELAERAARLYVKQRSARSAQSDSLPADEAAMLDAAGLDIAHAPPHEKTDPATEARTQYLEIFFTSMSVRETSALLGLSPGRVRERIRERSIAAISENRRYRVPRFQFVDDRLIPGFGDIHRAMPTDVPLILFYRWFTQPSPDLPAPDQDRDLSPKEWLLGGFDPAPVQRLAALL